MPIAGSFNWIPRPLVRRGESQALIWSAAYFFFLLFGYYLLRPVREAMGITRSAEALPWLMTGTLIAMFLVSPIFALLTARLPRRRFIPLTYTFFALNLLIFWALLEIVPEGGREWLGYAFYIWVSVYNLFAVSIFWAVMSDIFTSDQGKRLFGLIGVGGTFGAICGSSAVEALTAGFSVREVHISLAPHHLLLVSAGSLSLAILCVRRLALLPGMAATGPEREPGPSMMEGLYLLMRSRYLLLIAAFVLVFTILSTYLYLEQGRIIAGAAQTAEARTRYFARIDKWANILTIFVQIFLTGRIMTRFGVAAALGLLPLITIGGFAALLAAPTLTTLLVVQILRRGLHHAVSRPAREVLYTVVTPDARYKSKSFIDTFIYRSGDMAGAWSPALLRVVHIPLALAGLMIAILWLMMAVLLGRTHHRLSTAEARGTSTGEGSPPGGKPSTSEPLPA